MDENATGLCPDDLLAEVAALLQSDEAGGLARGQDLIARWPDDPRVQFLVGSVLAGQGRYDEALSAMRRAVELAPDFALARFQLGLLALSSGDAAMAEEVWQPLEALGPDDALALFAAGLRRLARDDFEGAAERLREGIARNVEYPPVNRDMGLVLAECEARLDATADPEPVSATDLLLRQSSTRPTRH